MQLAGIFPWLLERGVNHLAKQHTSELHLRLCVALASGLCHNDGNDGSGWFGDAISTAIRLAGAVAVRRLLHATSAPVVFVVSEDLHRDVIRHDFRLIDRDLFHSVEVVEGNDSPIRAWFHLPGPRSAPVVPFEPDLAGKAEQPDHSGAAAQRESTSPAPNAGRHRRGRPEPAS